MLKISRLADYAVSIMCALAKASKHCSANDIARMTNMTKTTASKILKLLTKGGLISSTRGAHGGYRLLQAPSEISLEAVVSAVDGPVALTACNTLEKDCAHLSCCEYQSNWRAINQVVASVLSSFSLADMMQPIKSNVAAKLGVEFKPVINIKIEDKHAK